MRSIRWARALPWNLYGLQIWGRRHNLYIILFDATTQENFCHCSLVVDRTVMHLQDNAKAVGSIRPVAFAFRFSGSNI